MKRKTVMVLTAALVLSLGAAGCGSEKAADTAKEEATVSDTTEEVAEAEPEKEIITDAEELLKRYDENNTGSYKMDYVSTMKLEASVEEVSMGLSVKIALKADCLDENLHGISSVEMAYNDDDEPEKQEIDLYLEKDGDSVLSYQADAGDDSWIVVRDDSSMAFLTATQSKLVTEDRLAGAELSYNDQADEYELIVPVMDTGDYGMLAGFLSEEMLYSFSNGDDTAYESFMGEIEKAKTHYIFDKDYNLVSVSIDPVDFAKKIGEGDMTGEIKIQCGMNCEYSGFGTVKEEDVIASAEIKENAEDVYGNAGETEKVSYEGATENVDTSLADFYGSIGGVNLKAGEKNDFAKTFGAAGFRLSKANDGEYGWADLLFDDYEDVNAKLYAEHILQSYDDVNKEIEENGFYGYEINVSASEVKPEMTFGGLTWGASLKDVVGVYGNPSDSTEMSWFTMLHYDLGNVSVDITVYNDGWLFDYPGGLQEFKVRYSH